MKIFFGSVFAIISLQLFVSCNNESKSKMKTDDVLSGNIAVLVDESVYPIVLEQQEVFESSYYNAKLNLISKSEVQAVNSLIRGEADVLILTRDLTKEENKSFEQRSVTPRVYNIGYDALVLIGNSSSKDSLIRGSDIFDILKGNSVKNITLVFEDLNSSAFRYFKDKGNIEKVSGTYIKTIKGLESLLTEISKENDKIGLISYNQYLSLESSFKEKEKIRILSVLNDSLSIKSGEDKYFKPNQTTLSTGEYPFKREIKVLNYQPKIGLGIGFSSFMTGDRGQRIMLKSGLLPATMPGREIIIRDNVN
jgi:phosphate transport system substrate-binding protein